MIYIFMVSENRMLETMTIQALFSKEYFQSLLGRELNLKRAVREWNQKAWPNFGELVAYQIALEEPSAF